MVAVAQPPRKPSRSTNAVFPPALAAANAFGYHNMEKPTKFVGAAYDTFYAMRWATCQPEDPEYLRQQIMAKYAELYLKEVWINNPPTVSFISDPTDCSHCIRFNF